MLQRPNISLQYDEVLHVTKAGLFGGEGGGHPYFLMFPVSLEITVNEVGSPDSNENIKR